MCYLAAVNCVPVTHCDTAIVLMPLVDARSHATTTKKIAAGISALIVHFTDRHLFNSAASVQHVVVGSGSVAQRPSSVVMNLQPTVPTPQFMQKWLA